MWRKGCRQLVHESNRFVLVVRLHSQLPPELLPGWAARDGTWSRGGQRRSESGSDLDSLSSSDDSDEEEEEEPDLCVMHVVLPDAVLDGGGGGASVGVEMRELMSVQQEDIFNWINGCMSGHALAPCVTPRSLALTSHTRAHSNIGLHASDNLAHDGLATGAATDAKAATRARHIHDQLQLVWHDRQKPHTLGRTLTPALADTHIEARAHSHTHTPAIPLPNAALLPQQQHEVYLSYNWRNSLSALGDNHVPQVSITQYMRMFVYVCTHGNVYLSI